jgi:hypothetical protein
MLSHLSAPLDQPSQSQLLMCSTLETGLTSFKMALVKSLSLFQA